jgi:hypothetical protein
LHILFFKPLSCRIVDAQELAEAAWRKARDCPDEGQVAVENEIRKHCLRLRDALARSTDLFDDYLTAVRAASMEPQVIIITYVNTHFLPLGTPSNNNFLCMLQWASFNLLSVPAARSRAAPASDSASAAQTRHSGGGGGGRHGHGINRGVGGG